MAGYEKKEKMTGLFHKDDGTAVTVTFSRVWAGIRFTDEMCERLLAGGMIEFPYVSAKGNPCMGRGKLEQQTFVDNNGVSHVFWGFKNDNNLLPTSLKGHVFTEPEIAVLESGAWLEIKDFVSSKNNRVYRARIRFVPRASGDGREFQWSFPKGDGWTK